MRKSLASIMLVTAAALSLGGCNSIFGSHRLRAADVSMEGGSEVGAVGQLAAGRQALDAGNYAAAIRAFSNIRTVPGFEADAYNGMAIGFEGIGRQDLAEAYFLRAVAIAPGNERFRRNLARFMAKVPAGKAEAVLAVQQQPATVRISGLQINDPAGQATHISSNEVFIRSDPSVVLWEPPARRINPVRTAAAARQRSRHAQVAGWWGRIDRARPFGGGHGSPSHAR